MMRSFLLGLALCLAAAPARAAGPTERFTVSFNAGYQAATNDFTDRIAFRVYQENGSTGTTYPIRGDLLFDGGATVVIWKNFAAGVTVSHFSRNGIAHTASRVPHPFFLERLRDVSGDVSGAARAETGAHVEIMYLAPVSSNVRFAIFAGPSYVNVTQDLVTAVRYQETYPYDVATFTGADTRSATGSALGFNAGVDVTYMFSRRLGAGGVVRFARARVDLKAPENRTLGVDAGGAQAGVGLRISF
jgi:hypothetical protein